MIHTIDTNNRLKFPKKLYPEHEYANIRSQINDFARPCINFILLSAQVSMSADEMDDETSYDCVDSNKEGRCSYIIILVMYSFIKI